MSEGADIASLLGKLDELRSVLDDLNVKYVTIASNGHWSFEKLGRTRQGSQPFDREILAEISARVPAGRQMRSGEWAVRKYDGVSGASLLIERLPVAVADRLPQEVLAALKRQVKRDGNGVLVGQPGSGKGALLLWLALQIPDEPVLYVSENPPNGFPGTHVMHVFPPSTPSERRGLERFVRLSRTVMWDRIASPHDLLTLYGFPGAGRRWFTLDSSSVRSALRMLTAATQNGCDARFSTLLSLASSVIGRPEARNLVLRDGSEWREEYIEGESVVELLEGYDSSDIRRLGPTEISRPGIPIDKPDGASADAAIADAIAEPPLEDQVDTDEMLREETDASEVDEAVVAAAEATPETTKPERANPAAFGDPHTIEVDVDDVEDIDNEEYQIHEIDYDDPQDAVTGMLARDEMRELREKQMTSTNEEDAVERDAPKAVANRAVPEVTKTYMETPEEVSPKETAERQASYLESVVPDLDDEPTGIPAVNMDDLRITTMEDVDEEDLEIIDDVDELADDFSGVFDGDLDFESLAEEMMSEISEVEMNTAVAQSNHYANETNPEHRIILSEDDLELVDPDQTADQEDHNPTISASADVLDLARQMQKAAPDQEDSTKEFTLNEKLLMLRNRQGED